MVIKAPLCSSNDASPQHQSVLRAIHPLTPPKNINACLGGLPHSSDDNGTGAQGLMWGARGQFPPVLAMVSCGWDGHCLPL